jgi:hypothetical protein
LYVGTGTQGSHAVVYMFCEIGNSTDEISIQFEKFRVRYASTHTLAFAAAEIFAGIVHGIVRRPRGLR